MPSNTSFVKILLFYTLSIVGICLVYQADAQHHYEPEVEVLGYYLDTLVSPASKNQKPSVFQDYSDDLVLPEKHLVLWLKFRVVNRSQEAELILDFDDWQYVNIWEAKDFEGEPKHVAGISIPYMKRTINILQR